MSDADVLTALRSLQPAGAPSWTPPVAAADADPLRVAFDAHAEPLYRYVSALTGRDAWLAEELVTRVFVGAATGDAADRAPEALFMQARHAALAVLAKAGDEVPGPVAPGELALVLERRAGLPLEALARTWGARPAALEARLIEAAQQHTVGDEACPDWNEATVRASVDLLTEDQGEAWAEHLMQCEPCAVWSEALEERLTSKDGLPSKERAWERVQAELGRHARDLGIRVGVRCTYCHAGLPQQDASFCAACLAPHHPECFEEHGACAAPACGGTQLVYPQRPKAAPRRRRGWPLVLAAGLVGGAAALSSQAWTRARQHAEGLAATQLAARPVPLDRLVPGASRATVEAVLGLPEGVTAAGPDGDETVLSYYSVGARVHLDREQRLIQASFFGTYASDEAFDASGNQSIGGPVGTYLPYRWSYLGVAFGDPATKSLLAAAVNASVADAAGDHFLEVRPGVFALLRGEGLRLVALHVAPNVVSDANGNVYPGTFELAPELVVPRAADDRLALPPREARGAAGDALRGAREGSALEAVLGTSYFVARDGSELARLEVSRAPDEAGLDLILDLWSAGRDGQPWSWRRAAERVAWDGGLSSLDSWFCHGPEAGGLAHNVAQREEEAFRVRALGYDFGAPLPAATEQVFAERRVPFDGPDFDELKCSGLLFTTLVLPRLSRGPSRVELELPSGTRGTVYLGYGEPVERLNGAPARRAAEHMVASPEDGGRILRLTPDARSVRLLGLRAQALDALDGEAAFVERLREVRVPESRAFYWPLREGPAPWELISGVERGPAEKKK
ncbi:MAG: hypothetical protein KDD82_29880 [Planctomycetes bacterium]|nr:hypothetical protein [Planctomycetota bacterium]